MSWSIKHRFDRRRMTSEKIGCFREFEADKRKTSNSQQSDRENSDFFTRSSRREGAAKRHASPENLSELKMESVKKLTFEKNCPS